MLKTYLPLVKFIAQVMGEHCEVILHDLSNVEHSIVAIENSHITGRAPGGPITDFALSTIFDPKYSQQDFIVNYKGQSSDGKKTFKSSTFYIRDESGQPVGLLCINYDVTHWLDAKKLLAGFTAFSDVQPQEDFPDHTHQPGLETFAVNMQDMLHSLIDRTLDETGVMLGRMLPEEKKQIVMRLNEKGAFTMKGAVSELAKKLDVSEQTIYRYLREVQA